MTFSQTPRPEAGAIVKIVRITFSHPVSGRELLKALMLSPSIGNYDVSVRDRTAEIRIYEKLKPGTTYRIILNKYMRDIRGLSLDNPVAIVFSDEGTTDSGIIAGKVYNYDLTPASEALLLAFSVGNQQTAPDYLVQAGPDGSFRIENIADGDYRIFAVNDRDHDMVFSPAKESTALPDRPSVASGTTSMLLRFAPDQKAQAATIPSASVQKNEQPGTLSGSCRATANALTVEALRHSDKTSFLTAAVRATKGLFNYIFPSLPPGTYTVSASIPSGSGNNRPPKAWKSGKLEPFTPSDPFGVYPDTVRIRPGWLTDAVDFSVRP